LCLLACECIRLQVDEQRVLFTVILLLYCSSTAQLLYTLVAVAAVR
jgi:hypothetical protein